MEPHKIPGERIFRKFISSHHRHRVRCLNALITTTLYGGPYYLVGTNGECPISVEYCRTGQSFLAFAKVRYLRLLDATTMFDSLHARMPET